MARLRLDSEGSRSGGAVVTLVERAKHAHYVDIFRLHNSLPVVFGIDVYGAVDDERSPFLSVVFTHTASRSRNHPYYKMHNTSTRSAFSLQEMIARKILTRHLPR